MRLLILQYAGDYREATQRLAAGGFETYYAQKYSVDAVAEIGKQIEEVAVLCCMTAEPYNQVLENGVRAIGAGYSEKVQVDQLIKLIEQQNPTHLIVRTPIRRVFAWAIKHKIPAMALFAESIAARSWRSRLGNYLLASLLNNKQITWIGTYGINSSLSFKNIGVNTDKIVPWDFINTETPDLFTPKTLQKTTDTWELFYIGSMIEAKGVGDILESVAKLKAKSFPVSLRIAGKDKDTFYANKAKQLGIADCVEFLGIVPNNTVVTLMREADVVLIPSRHEYPEGFPLAITHALCSRTPIVTSDHPMFKNNLRHGVSAMIFPSGNSIALAETITKLLTDPELYFSLSLASATAWEQLQIPVKWAEMINRWLDDSQENQQWLFEHRLTSGLYNLTFA